MLKNWMALASLVFVLLVGCWAPYAPPTVGPDGSTNTDVDSEQHEGGDTTTTINVCSVDIVLNFSRQVVSFYNENDNWVWVGINRLELDPDTAEYVVTGIIVENTLMNDGTDTESAAFDHGDIVEITVELWDLGLEPITVCAIEMYTLG